MSKAISTMKTIFDNGDEVSLNLSLCHFVGFKKEQVYQLCYWERFEGNYYHETCPEGSHYFMATATEYFPKNMVGVATEAFIKRSNSDNPAAVSGNGFQLADFLEKEETTIKEETETPIEWLIQDLITLDDIGCIEKVPCNWQALNIRQLVADHCKTPVVFAKLMDSYLTQFTSAQDKERIRMEDLFMERQMTDEQYSEAVLFLKPLLQHHTKKEVQ